MLSYESELRVDAEMSRINPAIAAIRSESSRAEALDFELTLARCVRWAVNECAETEVIQSASQATLASGSPLAYTRTDCQRTVQWNLAGGQSN